MPRTGSLEPLARLIGREKSDEKREEDSDRLPDTVGGTRIKNSRSWTITNIRCINCKKRQQRQEMLKPCALIHKESLGDSSRCGRSYERIAKSEWFTESELGDEFSIPRRRNGAANQYLWRSDQYPSIKRVGSRRTRWWKNQHCIFGV